MVRARVSGGLGRAGAGDELLYLRRLADGRLSRLCGVRGALVLQFP